MVRSVRNSGMYVRNQIQIGEDELSVHTDLVADSGSDLNADSKLIIHR